MGKIFGKRGQAALEFLTTYGWAFMVILVMIGALAYFGVLNPQNLIPDQCAITSGFTCTDFQVKEDEVGISITNNMGQGISITESDVKRNGVSIDGIDCVVLDSTDGLLGDTDAVGDGERFKIVCDSFDATDLGKNAGGKVKLGYDFKYVKVGEDFDHLVTGTLTATVQESETTPP